MCVCAFVCVPLVCVHVHECYVCLCGRTCVYVHVCVYAQLKMIHMCRTYVHYECMCILCMYVCMYVCMYEYMHVLLVK